MLTADNIAQRELQRSSPSVIDKVLASLQNVVNHLDLDDAALQALAPQEREAHLLALKLAAERVLLLNGEFRRRGGWTRWYVVPGGHFHNTSHCSSFKWKTVCAFLPELSGLSEETVIQKYGDRVCTVCCPNAPLSPDWRTIPDDTLCPDSGRQLNPVQAKHNMGWCYPRCVRCSCGASVSVSRNGKLRKHKLPKERKS